MAGMINRQGCRPWLVVVGPRPVGEPLLIFQSSRLRWCEAPPKDVRLGAQPPSGSRTGAPFWGLGGLFEPIVATFEQFHMVNNNGNRTFVRHGHLSDTDICPTTCMKFRGRLSDNLTSN